MSNRIGTGLSSKIRIYTATITGVVAGTGVQLASVSGNARVGNGNTTLPVILTSDMAHPQGPSSCVQGLNIRNTGSKTLYVLCTSTDTTAAGYPIYPGEAARVDVRDGMNTYLACVNGESTTVAVWEV